MPPTLIEASALIEASVSIGNVDSRYRRSKATAWRSGGHWFAVVHHSLRRLHLVLDPGRAVESRFNQSRVRYNQPEI